MLSSIKSGYGECPFCLSDQIEAISLASYLEKIPEGLSRGKQANFEGIACRACGSISSSKLFNADLYSDGFYSKSDNYSRVSPAYDYSGPLVNIVLRASKKGKVLDFGAGQGSAAAHMRTLGVCVDVLEPDEGYQKQLRASFDTVYSDITDITHKYSCIYAVGVLEHLSDIRAVLASLCDSLEDNGLLIFQYPNPRGLTARVNLRKWDMLFESGHNYIPSVRGLRTMLNGDSMIIDRSYSSSILSRGRIPFFWARNAQWEQVMKSLVRKNRVVRFLYKAAWELQGKMGLGETLVVIIKKRPSKEGC